MSMGPLTAREQAVNAAAGARTITPMAGNLPLANADETGAPNGMPQYKRGKKVRK